MMRSSIRRGRILPGSQIDEANEVSHLRGHGEARVNTGADEVPARGEIRNPTVPASKCLGRLHPRETSGVSFPLPRAGWTRKPRLDSTQ
jgi:hypothetical protein